MWRTNNALTPDPELEPGLLTSSPWDWPLLTKGIRMSSWADNAVKFYMLGNPLIWWGSALSVLAISALSVLHLIRYQRNPLIEKSKFRKAAQIALGGWILHYFPFFIMGRVTYLHHYFPALFYAILCSGLLFDEILSSTKKAGLETVLVLLLSFIIFASFVHFAPICYGMTGPASDYATRLWRSSWNLVDLK